MSNFQNPYQKISWLERRLNALESMVRKVISPGGVVSGGTSSVTVVGVPEIHTHQGTGEGGTLDHGLALTGKTDDDHTIYLLAAGTRALTGKWVQSANLGIYTAGAMNVGASTDPANTTAGDAHVARLMVGTDTAFPSGLIAYIKQPTMGNEVWRLESVSTDNARISWYQGRVATTDETFTTLVTVAIPTDQTVQFTGKAQGRRTGGASGTAGDSGCYEDRAAFKNIGGTVTQIGATQHTLDLEDQAPWDTDFAVSGTNVVYQVKGAANNNVTWHGHCVAAGYVP